MAKSQRKIFISGTDTDVGKTLVSAALIKAFQQNATSVSAIKPVAAGCDLIDGVWKNADALILIEAMQTDASYQKVNPIALKQAVAPHIAAANESKELSVELIQASCPLAEYKEDILLIEGAGGWLVPLNQQQTFADYVAQESLEVILVVGLKLGCINHALLTQQSILAMGIKLIGWVANHIDPQMLQQRQNIETLKQRLNCPLIAEIPYLQGDNLVAQATSYVRIAAII